MLPLSRRKQVVVARFNRRLVFLRASGSKPGFAVSHVSQPVEPAFVPASSTESDGVPACSGDTELDRIIDSTDALGGSIVSTASGSIFQRMICEKWNTERCAVHNLCRKRVWST